MPVLVAALCISALPAAAAEAERCELALTVDRVFRMGRYPAALVTVEHDCPHSFASIRISCTWLAKDKPVAVNGAVLSNVRPGVPASAEVYATSGRGVAFESARCRVERTRR